MRQTALSDWLAQELDRGGTHPLYRQLHRLLQHAILSKRMRAGSKMPSSRLLAMELNVARNTVTQVYEQLGLEGYVTSSKGRGTFVVDMSPDEVLADEQVVSPTSSVVEHLQQLSLRGKELLNGAGVFHRQSGAFMPGVPDMSRFPAHVWNRLHAKHWRRITPELLTYAPAGGLPALRHVLADYLMSARSVRCTPEQIIITTGTHQSIDLAVRMLTDVGDMIWTEDPCYWGIRSILKVSGLDLRAIPVDDEGLNPSAEDLTSPPKLILATPSHQYPLGMVMSLVRRRALLAYARLSGSWIIEDDYDSEFRYGNQPLASLQGLDKNDQVLYVGSLSKTLFPGLRVGYLVVPPNLAAQFAVASAELYREGQSIQQLILADFIEGGHMTSHIRRMRGLYAHRRDLLLEAVARRYGGDMKTVGGEAGLHLVLRLPDDVDDRSVATAALQAGIVVRPLSGYFSSRTGAQRGLLIGYACVPDNQIEPAFEKLATVIDTFL